MREKQVGMGCTTPLFVRRVGFRLWAAEMTGIGRMRRTSRGPAVSRRSYSTTSLLCSRASRQVGRWYKTLNKRLLASSSLTSSVSIVLELLVGWLLLLLLLLLGGGRSTGAAAFRRPDAEAALMVLPLALRVAIGDGGADEEAE